MENAIDNKGNKIIYAVQLYFGNDDTTTAFESESEAEARARYEQEVKSAGEPVDVDGWGDSDQGWRRLFHIELNKYEFDEDDELIDVTGPIESSGYFKMI